APRPSREPHAGVDPAPHPSREPHAGADAAPRPSREPHAGADAALRASREPQAEVARSRREPHEPAGRPVRSWLAEVLRNAARMRARGGRRRLARDGAFADVAAGEAPSPEQLLERLQTQRLLAGIVAGLDEPYRSTLLLHYYEGLSSAEIARLQGVPAGTVRWRLKTGLDRLRAGLDRESPGGRRLWVLALWPLVDRAALGPAGLWQHAWKGALIMGHTGKVAAVAAVVATSGALFFAAQRAPAAKETVLAASAPAPGPAAPPAAVDARRLRDAMRDEIVAALRKREAEAARLAAPAPAPAPAAVAAPAAASAAPAASADDPPGGPLPVGHYEPAYIQEVFREAMFPLLRQCYENALAQRPKLAGKFVLAFAIVADPSVGGVVDEAGFGPESDIKDPEMEACLRESLLTLTFDKPMQGGGRVTVNYPVEFSPGDDEGAAGEPGAAR
ncbi:MAG TPA: sigma-70 family RNA polymerase sigma factor, partial [Polyangiaceae bacterium]|nr:sigma-70 family RNA polymerase sigma factor [Polyangiaceae bacterium]